MGPPSMRNKEQEKTILQKQTPSTPTLKRKTFEASAETPTWTPLKRFYITLQIHNHASMANETSSRLDVSPLEIDIYSASENDALFQQAEACSKELDVVSIATYFTLSTSISNLLCFLPIIAMYLHFITHNSNGLKFLYQ